jgi:hypothetical protein
MTKLQTLTAAGRAPHASDARPSDTAAIVASIARALAAAPRIEEPYAHWNIVDMLPQDTVEALIDLPFPALELGGVSGRRELHNDARIYFDAGNMAKYPVCRAVAEAFQSPETVAAVEAHTGSSLAGTYLRIEYARDVEGFWLEPHTDLGVKKYTMLYYLGAGPEQDHLGTDMYSDAKTWAKRSAFTCNTALVFVPSDRTWHGFEPRDMPGLRKSVIINYVTNEWRQREQLAFPHTPVGAH